MGKVIKRGNKKQTFSPTKIRNSIQAAAKEAKLHYTKAKALTKEIGEPVITLYKNKRLIKTTDLRRSILRRLDRRAKKVSSAWKRYDKKRKKR